MNAPEERITVQGNTSVADSVLRKAMPYHIRPHATDSGLIIRDTADYWCNMDLRSARTLGAWILSWVAYQQERFKPVGWMLTNPQTQETRKIVDGAIARLVGDSFYICDADGTQISEALPALDWELKPMFKEATP